LDADDIASYQQDFDGWICRILGCIQRIAQQVNNELLKAEPIP
jgi:hypothetical protein